MYIFKSTINRIRGKAVKSNNNPGRCTYLPLNTKLLIIRNNTLTLRVDNKNNISRNRNDGMQHNSKFP